MYFGMASKAFGVRSFVLRECRLNQGSQSPIVLVGRRRGLFSWLRALVRIDDSVILEASPHEISLSARSLGGEYRETVPMSAVSNLGTGYLKPIGFLLMAAASLPVVSELFRELLEASAVFSRAHLVWKLAMSMLFFISSVVAYFLRKCVVLHVVSRSGYGLEVAFSRSLVEGVPMDEATGKWIVDALMDMRFGRRIRPLSTVSSRLSADRSRKGLFFWSAGICGACLAGALAVGWIRHDGGESFEATLPEQGEAELSAAESAEIPAEPNVGVKELLDESKKPEAAQTDLSVAVEKPAAESVEPAVEFEAVDPLAEGLAALKAKDYSLALKQFGLAAEKGDPIAFNALGLMFRNGLGVEADPEVAVVFFRAACTSVPQANAGLAACFEDGYGVRRNVLVARSYYRQAMELGDRTAEKKVEALGESALREDASGSLFRAEEDLRKAEAACAGTGYPPLEAALRTISKKERMK